MSEEVLEKTFSDWSTYNPGSHKDIKKIIQDNINSVCANYVAIGYYLNVVNGRKLYEEDGYSGIGEYAAAEYGIKEDKCSYLRKIANKFCIPNSPALLPEYRDFTVHKLREMIYLTDEQLEHVTIATTVAEIRDIRKPELDKLAISQLNSEIKSPHGYGKSVYPPDSLITSKGCGNKYDCFSCSRICQIRQEDRYCVEAPMGHPYSCTTMNVIDSIDNDIGSDCMFINLELAYHRAGDHEPSPCCKECKNKCGYACSKAAYGSKWDDIPVSANNTLEIVDNQSGTVNNVDETKPCIRCSLNGNPDAGILECHPERGEHSCWIEDEPEEPGSGNDEQGWHEEQIQGESEDTEPVETIEADIIQPDKKYDFDKTAAYELLDVKFAISDHADNLAQYKDAELDAPIVKRTKMEYDALKLLEEDMYMPELKEPPKPVQPELPILKNNDQRKEWIDNYTAWPIWIDLKETGERYYRYDFDNGISFVIRVSLHHKFIGWDKGGYSKTETEYSMEKYFIVGDPGREGEAENKTFREGITNKSAMVEFLKELQKNKGGV